jgi:hypothetical protein
LAVRALPDFDLRYICNNETHLDAARCPPDECSVASGAFSSEVDTGSREENASKQESRASVLIQSEPIVVNFIQTSVAQS